MSNFRPVRKTAKNASFTLLETVIAVAIMSTMIAELTGLLGNTIYFSEYGSHSTRAIWLAKRVLSQVEYQWRHRPFGDLTRESKEEIPFEDYPDYKYRLTVVEWKLDLLELLTGGGLPKDDDNSSNESASEMSQLAGGEAAKNQFEAIFGDEPVLQIAEVEVIWAEGATRNSIRIPYLLTNQKKIDEAIFANKAVYDDVLKKESASGNSGGQENRNRGNNRRGGPAGPGDSPPPGGSDSGGADGAGGGSGG